MFSMFASSEKPNFEMFPWYQKAGTLRERDVMRVFCVNYFCIGYFSVAVIKCHDLRHLENEEVILAYYFRRLKVYHGREAWQQIGMAGRHNGQNRELRIHILNYKNRGESANWKCGTRLWLETQILSLVAKSKLNLSTNCHDWGLSSNIWVYGEWRSFTVHK